MCIVIDPPMFVPLFKESDSQHHQYIPVKNWVDQGSGKFVLGGTKYTSELSRIGSVIPILTEYEKMGRIYRESSAKVDAHEAQVKLIEPSRAFDDPHLVALIRATGCRLICVNDPKSHRFLRDGRFYASPKNRPKLYTRVKNKSLLCAGNIASCCK